MKNDDYSQNLIGAFATAVASSMEAELAALGGHSINHESALVVLSNHPDDGIDMLSKVLGITHSGAVRLVDTLETEGLVQRKPSPRDARAVIVRITAKGRNRATKVLRARARVTQNLLGRLDGAEKEALIPALETLLAAMTVDRSGARRICRFCDEGVCRAQGCPVEAAAQQSSG